MHARPEIREVLIGMKLRRWCLISTHPFVDKSCPPARARRNYWRLLAKYPEIAAKLGLSEISVYERPQQPKSIAGSILIIPMAYTAGKIGLPQVFPVTF